MSHTTKFPNGSSLVWSGDDFLAKVEQGYVIRTLTRVSAEVEMEAQKLIRAPKHGVVYKIGKRSYTASAPGEAPAVRTGRLRQSIRYVIKKTGKHEWTSTIGPTVKDYPSYLETGTKHMKPRPLWGPALKNCARRIPAIMRIERV